MALRAPVCGCLLQLGAVAVTPGAAGADDEVLRVLHVPSGQHEIYIRAVKGQAQLLLTPSQCYLPHRDIVNLSLAFLTDPSPQRSSHLRGQLSVVPSMLCVMY